MSEEKQSYVLIHIRVRRDIYEKLWEVIKKRYVVPTKKLQIVVNEALEKYLEQK